MVTLQDMALAYLSNISEEIRRQKELISQNQLNLKKLEQHYEECQGRLTEDPSEKLEMIGKAPVITTKAKEPVTFNSQAEEPSINDQYK